MKKKLSIVCLVLFGVLFFSCGGDDPVIEKEVIVPTILTTETTSIEFGSEGGSEAVKFMSTQNWTVENSNDWFSISPEQGSGNANGDVFVSVRCQKNASLEERSATFSIIAKEKRINISVKQAGSSGIVLEENEIEVSSLGGIFSLPIIYNSPYRIEIDSDWISFVEEYDTKSVIKESVKFCVKNNDTFFDRIGKIKFVCLENKDEVEFLVKQKQLDVFEVVNLKTTYNLLSDEQTLSLLVKTNVNYICTLSSSSDDWLTIKKSENSTDYREETIDINICKNESESRSTYFSIKALEIDSIYAEFEIVQFGDDCYSGDIVLSTEEDFDYWGTSRYTHIFGDVTIMANENIKNLSKLNNKWETISGELYIYGEFLTSLEGLDNLKVVGDITIDQYNGMYLYGLTSLKRVDYSMIFKNQCRPLVNFKGLENLEYIGQDLEFRGGAYDFHEVQNVYGFENLEYIGGSLVFYSDFYSLTSFKGFNSLKEIGNDLELYKASNSSFYSFDQICNFTGFNNVTRIGGRLALFGSFENLENFIGFENLEYVGALSLGGGAHADYYCWNKFKNFEGLEKLKYIGRFSFSEQSYAAKEQYSSFESLKGLENVEYLGGIWLNFPKLNSLEVFSNVKNTEVSSLDIRYEGKNLKGLEFLKKITKEADLPRIHCPNLTSLEGLNNLESIEDLSSGFYITSNPKLTDISALKNLQPGGRLCIEDNPRLYDLSPLYDWAQGAKSKLSIKGNGYNPTIEQIKNGEGNGNE